MKRVDMGNSIQRRSGSGGANKKRNQDFINTPKAKISTHPATSFRKLASEIELDHKNVRAAMNDNLGLKSYNRTPRRLLAEPIRARRLERRIGVLKKSRSAMKIFSDEKIFTVDNVVNRRNNRYIASEQLTSKTPSEQNIQPSSLLLWLVTDERCPSTSTSLENKM
ncbi:uncharacterized protein LOC115214833 [Octopus sinensis]|uniref:Uncharacterized protein LOC115214833 n=1 Tax=Octopus sinensis TaxID=2607531 RepID=A0A6P7SPC3_9MOLL|nr:uncharacterized protein LOC115214833 [Octopus sinensis]